MSTHSFVEPLPEPLSSRPLLLLVDDQLAEVRELTELLRPLYRLALVAEARSALYRAQALQPSLVLLDVGMPGLDGFALCRLLKADPLTRHIPVLFVSAHGAPAERVRGLSLGAVDFISKPICPEEVLARVRVHLRLAEQARHGTEVVGEVAPPAALSRDPEAVLVHSAVAFIREHLGEELSVSQIAREVGTYEKRLLALFSAHVGQTVSGFLRSERLNTGLRLLTETEMPVQEIARQVGYGNPGNFSTAFRDRHGLSPQAYRQAHWQGRRNSS